MTSIRAILGTLLAFGALNAFGGGYYGLAGAKGVPTQWLAGSPFTSYFIPSLILFVIVGGSLLAASVAVFAAWRWASRMTVAAALIVLGWITVQIAIIGFVSWLQPVTAITGVILLGLAPTVSNTGPNESAAN